MNNPATTDLVLKAITNYDNHSTILNLKDNMKDKELSFDFLTRYKSLLKIQYLGKKKAFQENDTLVEIIKEDTGILLDFVFNQ